VQTCLSAGRQEVTACKNVRAIHGQGQDDVAYVWVPGRRVPRGVVHGGQVIPRRIADLEEAAAQVDGWMDLMLELAEAIDLYEANPVLKKTLSTLPSELEKLKIGLDQEGDQHRKEDMQRDIEVRQQQLDKLQVIEQGILQANARIDAILAQLRKVYALTQVPPDVKE